ncbi:membrane-bound serine protease (ClpP class) [Geomicrobium halophilum]|uniref:Membrane-bound serine protease (ClpP class) n=1 Tax=Geomicrobium halophilum TaxID=549000 RepID=A0A841Q0D8_9BACL|nr:nodulation protein NfeD [Geomicrobium halophilum]MBB6448828.1 membrane-bound serine protease (ClpP class) [Geomicrobium halophilum]
MGKNVRIGFFLLLMIAAAAMMPLFSSAQGQDSVHFIPVEQTVERGLEAFLDRSIDEAVEEGADHVVLEIDTPGGAVDAAGNIAEIIQNAEVDVTAYVTGDASSAGAYIALNADYIVMDPGASMGSASVVDGSGNAAEDKAQGVWISNMENAAERNDRDTEYARAMVDPSVDVEEGREGGVLNLTATQAMDVGYAEAIVDDRDELLALDFIDMEGAEQVEAEVSLAEQVTRWITNPMVIPLLLSVGGIGLLWELFSPGFGLPGLVGLGSLGLFFFGHMFAGFAGMEAIILLILGLILIVVEVAFTGFGLFGLLGVASIIGSVFLASFDTTQILVSVFIAMVLVSVAAVLLFKYFGKIGFMQKLVLSDTFGTDEGYISRSERQDLVGQIGRSLTPLRPSGLMFISGEHFDVVTEGNYVEEGSDVKVISVSGSRIVVRAVDQ